MSSTPLSSEDLVIGQSYIAFNKNATNYKKSQLKELKLKYLGRKNGWNRFNLENHSVPQTISRNPEITDYYLASEVPELNQSKIEEEKRKIEQEKIKREKIERERYNKMEQNRRRIKEEQEKIQRVKEEKRKQEEEWEKIRKEKRQKQLSEAPGLLSKGAQMKNKLFEMIFKNRIINGIEEIGTKVFVKNVNWANEHEREGTIQDIQIVIKLDKPIVNEWISGSSIKTHVIISKKENDTLSEDGLLYEYQITEFEEEISGPLEDRKITLEKSTDTRTGVIERIDMKVKLKYNIEFGLQSQYSISEIAIPGETKAWKIVREDEFQMEDEQLGGQRKNKTIRKNKTMRKIKHSMKKGRGKKTYRH
jgi:hypothetical protein